MNRIYLYILSSLVWLSSCVSLKTVNTFSKSTIGSLKQHKTLPATFTGIYQGRVQDDSLALHPFNQIPLIGIDFAERVRRDSLRSYQLADSLTNAGSLLLINYFQAIDALSNPSSSFVPIRLQSKSFDSFLQGSAVKLTTAETAAFNRVANLVGSLATGTYRRKKLKNILEQSHQDVQQMIAVLAFAHERLADVVDISREQQYGYYKNILIQDRSLTYSQKRDLARQWLQTAKTIEQQRQSVLTHVKTLKTIRSGYEELYQNRTKWNSKASLAGIGAYINTLEQLRGDLEQLTPVYGRLHP
jgi:hypothetical protein